jgi:superfamily I DNA/RNA helicase/RecB family exonuclease
VADGWLVPMSSAEPRTTYTLAAPAVSLEVPALDEHQRRVVEHRDGPLLVLAGPGTGKTTTLVEAVVDRVERGARPDGVLALTFSRKAAEQLRDRITARLGRTTAATASSTFHSFAYALVRRYAPAELYATPLRLLSAPEQDVVLAELLAHSGESVRWPESLRRALGTRGFAREVHDVLARAREKGLDGPALSLLGAEHALPEFEAAGYFMDHYLDVLDSLGAIDYGDLIRRAALEAEAHREELRAEFSHVFVDEYQDTDPGQVDLLRALAGDGRNLTVVGDPHQSIYGFRGAEVRGILEFPTSFPRVDGSPADVVALQTTRRFGPHVLLGAQRVARRLALPGTIPDAAKEAFLSPTSSRTDPGKIEVWTFDTERAESEHLADILRRAHLEEEVAWSDMAVVVRSGQQSIPALRRSLTAAGVPVEVAADDTPLVHETAVRPLLQALRMVLHLEEEDPSVPTYVDGVAVQELLMSPLGGMDATDVRTLARALRIADRSRAEAQRRSPRPSAELVRSAVLSPGLLEEVPGRAGTRARALGALLRGAREQLVEGATAEEVLWHLWSGTVWPRRLRTMVENGGSSARMAHRDLDAICALFDTAARAEEQQGHTGVGAFLASLTAQDLPADTLSERGVRGEAVRLLTAHRSKGLEWELVVVAHVQEEGWPDLRRRATLLRADRIGRGQLQEPTSARESLQEERRLFYVACTRARRRLVVTAVRSAEDEGEQPSRFLAELEVAVNHLSGRPSRPLSLSGLVAELRRGVADTESSAGLRAAAADRLAALASERRGQSALVPQADPASWWGTRGLSASAHPLREAERPVTMSASTLSSLLECPAHWFLEREAGGATSTTSSQGFGLVVHALAERVARGELGQGEAPLAELMAMVDQVWEQIPFRTPWSSSRERQQVESALRRFLAWHHDPAARTLVEVEQRLQASVVLPDGQHVTLYGFADRIEIDDDGQVVVVDLKTGKYKPTKDEVEKHPQLALYQYAVTHGALDEALAPHLRGGPVVVGGAELVQLRHEARGSVVTQFQPPPDLSAEGPILIEEQLSAAVGALRTEEFPARSGAHCDRCDFITLCPIKGSGTVLS